MISELKTRIETLEKELLKREEAYDILTFKVKGLEAENTKLIK